jgi:hypothetical protein
LKPRLRARWRHRFPPPSSVYPETSMPHERQDDRTPSRDELLPRQDKERRAGGGERPGEDRPSEEMQGQERRRRADVEPTENDEDFNIPGAGQNPLK